MRIPVLACLLLIESFTACKRNQEIPRSMEANVNFASATFDLPSLECTAAPATNIVYRSVDGGQTWEDVSAGLPKDYYVACIYANNDEVVLSSEKGMYRSSASMAAPAWEKDLFCSENVTNISPGRTGRYFCSYGNGLFREIPGTGVWVPLHENLQNRRIRTVLETPDGGLLVGSDTGIFKSADQGKTWKQVFDGGLVLDLVASGKVLIGGSMQGVVRSTDGGEHWELTLDENILAKKTRLIDGQFFTILGTEDVSKACSGGITNRLRTSSDGGKTWQRMEKALLPIQDVYDMDDSLLPAHDLYDIVRVGKSLLCTFDTGIYRSNDQGKTWECVLPTIEKRTLANMAVSGKVVYVVLGGGC